jgi:hypothetical protein
MSKIEVDAIDKQSGSTLTLGGSGTAVTLACGATQSGFGRTGTVDWQTGSIKTATFTATSGEGYFCNTAGGSFEVDLPAGSAGAIVSIQDYNNTFDSNSLIIDPNGSEKINGGEAGGTIELTTEGEGVTLVYIDSTVGWRSIHQSTFADASQNPAFITATGGTITTVCTDYKVHTFTGPGTFTVCSVGNSAGSNTVSYMVIAGGGEGGSAAPSNGAGGGGAGGYREGRTPQCNSWTASPTACTSGCNAGVPVSAQGYPITVGAGGAQQPQPSNNLGNPGNNSIFSTITSTGGGGGKLDNNPAEPGTAGDGGSGSGGAAASPGNAVRRNGGSGNTPPVSPAQGKNGGAGGPNSDSLFGGGGGGGAGAVGQDVNPGPSGKAGNGGCGTTSSINGTPTVRAGGGGASSTACSPGDKRGLAGPGGGGIGGFAPNGDGGAGTVNTGGGGGAGGYPATGSARGGGGSGIVVIRYRFQ